MKAHKVIEKHTPNLRPTVLMFWVWLTSKHPNGVLARNINYPLAKWKMVRKYLNELRDIGYIRIEHKKANHEKITICQ